MSAASLAFVPVLISKATHCQTKHGIALLNADKKLKDQLELSLKAAGFKRMADPVWKLYTKIRLQSERDIAAGGDGWLASCAFDKKLKSKDGERTQSRVRSRQKYIKFLSDAGLINKARGLVNGVVKSPKRIQRSAQFGVISTPQNAHIRLVPPPHPTIVPHRAIRERSKPTLLPCPLTAKDLEKAEASWAPQAGPGFELKNKSINQTEAQPKAPTPQAAAAPAQPDKSKAAGQGWSRPEAQADTPADVAPRPPVSLCAPVQDPAPAEPPTSLANDFMRRAMALAAKTANTPLPQPAALAPTRRPKLTVATTEPPNRPRPGTRAPTPTASVDDYSVADTPWLLATVHRLPGFTGLYCHKQGPKQHKRWVWRAAMAAVVQQAPGRIKDPVAYLVRTAELLAAGTSHDVRRTPGYFCHQAWGTRVLRFAGVLCSSA